MSSTIVVYELQDKIKTLCDGLLPPINFYNTLNLRTNPSKDETWCTSTFYAFNANNICYGGAGVIETGNCTVNLFCKGGTGWQELRAIADTMITEFRKEPLNGVGTSLVITNVSPPNEASQGDANQWYTINFEMEYQLFI